MTSPKRDGKRVKQPSTSNSHTPKGGRAGKTAMKMGRQGKMASKYGKASMPKRGSSHHY